MPCLTPEQIEGIALGLANSDGDGLRAHLDGCQLCREQVDECRANEQMLKRLQHFSDRHPPDGASWLRGAPSLPAADAIPGYQVVREIHRGGQGVVYEAVQESTRRTVAVKVLLEGQFAGERAKWRFEREVRLVAALRHPNIVVIHDSGITHGKYYFAMDYVRGQPLDTHVRLARCTIREIVGLFRQICDAVSYAHRRGVIHRDLKPSNILVNENGEPCILDFGLAKIVSDELAQSQAEVVSIAGSLMGTLRYMSPEQTLGSADAIDIRTDVYSLGVILYELLTGAPPYPTNTDLAKALDSIRGVTPPRPSKLCREINSELDCIILRALAKESERRYQSAGELREDLTAWLEGRPVNAKSDSSLYVLRKLAVRHYFHTLVLAALVASVFGFAGVTYHEMRQSQRTLQEKEISEANARMAWKGMSKFFEEAQATLKQQSLGWFLLEWSRGRLERAREIQKAVRAESPEYAAMAYLLDSRMADDELRKALPPRSEPMLHFIIGERQLKDGRPDEARREWQQSEQADRSGGDWYARASAARLAQLAGTTRPGSSGP